LPLPFLLRQKTEFLEIPNDDLTATAQPQWLFLKDLRQVVVDSRENGNPF